MKSALKAVPNHWCHFHPLIYMAGDSDAFFFSLLLLIFSYPHWTESNSYLFCT